MTRLTRTFSEMLGLLARGEFSRKLDQEMEKAIFALEEMPADKGKATMTVTIDFNYELGRIDIDPKVKVKLPDDAKFVKTPFWSVDGKLSIEHPNQIDMFGGPRSTRSRDDGDDADAETEDMAADG